MHTPFARTTACVPVQHTYSMLCSWRGVVVVVVRCSLCCGLRLCTFSLSLLTHVVNPRSPCLYVYSETMPLLLLFLLPLPQFLLVFAHHKSWKECNFGPIPIYLMSCVASSEQHTHTHLRRSASLCCGLTHLPTIHAYSDR